MRGRRCVLVLLACIAVFFGLYYQIRFSSNFAKKWLLSDQDFVVSTSRSTAFNSTERFGPLQCENKQHGPCCSSWDVDTDEWWTHHPDWEISSENDTSFCFSRIRDQQKASFFRRIYEIQWNGNCSDVLQTFQIGSGYGASVYKIYKAFFAAFRLGRPFQMTKHWEGFRWMFAPEANTSWAYCQQQDLNCYILPLSHCPPQIGREDGVSSDPGRKSDEVGKKESLEFVWLKQYVHRMRQHVRKKIWDTTRGAFPEVKLPCTAIHVRRGDSGLPVPPFRRYAAVAEYIKAGKIQPGDNIVLLSDDVTTIDETHKRHPEYNWIYMDRPRVLASMAGFDSHVPSKHPEFDFVAIQVEVSKASLCQKFVHGHSGFSKIIMDGMDRAGTNFTRYYVDTAVSRAEAKNFTGNRRSRGHQMLQLINEQHLSNRATLSLLNASSDNASAHGDTNPSQATGDHADNKMLPKM